MLTAPQVAKLLGCKYWHLRRVFDLRLVHAPKVGPTRVITEDQLPAIRRALISEGFLPAAEGEAAEPAAP
jgi:hypothetical protein